MGVMYAETFDGGNCSISTCGSFNNQNQVLVELALTMLASSGLSTGQKRLPPTATPNAPPAERGPAIG